MTPPSLLKSSRTHTHTHTILSFEPLTSSKGIKRFFVFFKHLFSSFLFVSVLFLFLFPSSAWLVELFGEVNCGLFEEEEAEVLKCLVSM